MLESPFIFFFLSYRITGCDRLEKGRLNQHSAALCQCGHPSHYPCPAYVKYNNISSELWYQTSQPPQKVVLQTMPANHVLHKAVFFNVTFSSDASCTLQSQRSIFSKQLCVTQLEYKRAPVIL